MGNPHGSTNLASCKVATFFLIFIVIVLLIAFFTVVKPRNPKIAVSAVQLPSFSVANGTINFTFCEYVSIRNPNKASFSHYDSSIQLLYSGSQIGFMVIPAGKIDAGQTQYMAATFPFHSFPSAAPVAAVRAGPTFSVHSFPSVAPVAAVGAGPTSPEGMNGYGIGPTLEIESKMYMAGRVKVLHFFTHHVKATSSCSIAIVVSDGSVLGFHC